MNRSFPDAARSSRAAGWVRAVALGALAWGVWDAAVRALPEVDSDNWDRRGASVPVESAELAGDLLPDPGAVDLWGHRAVSPRLAPLAAGWITLEAVVPTDGQLVLRLGGDDLGGPHAPQGPDPRRKDAPRPGGSPNDSGGGGGPGPLRNASPGTLPPGPLTPVGGPGTSGRGVAVVVDRSAHNVIRGQGLTCRDIPAPTTARFRLDVAFDPDGVDLTIDGLKVGRCTGRVPGDGRIVLASGVRRIQVDDLVIGIPGGARWTDDFGGPARAPLAGLVVAGLGVVLGALAAARRGTVAWARTLPLAPFLAVPLLAQHDLRGVLDALRLLDVPSSLAPLLVTSVPALALAAVQAGRNAPTAQLAAIRGLAIVPVVLVLALLGGARESLPGLVGLGLLGVPACVLAQWTAPGRPRSLRGLLPLEGPLTRSSGVWGAGRHAFVAWALSLVLVGGAELALRATAVDRAWVPTAGFARAREEFAELLEIRRYRSYPDEGFPVQPPVRDPARPRIVAMGGSSTGGAFQMDNLDLFWPRQLEEQLAATGGPAWEVVNQGVGGWNTLHVRLYLESQVTRLAPDILVVYIGHNDILTASPVPYRDLYARYRAPAAGVQRVSRFLERSRLYVGLRFALLGVRTRDGAVAVPVPHADENVRAILDVAAKAQPPARVLLVSEGLSPDGTAMRTYAQMLASKVQPGRVAFLDAAAGFDRAGEPDLFLDDCHLSLRGHARLAGWIREALAAQGWLARG